MKTLAYLSKPRVDPDPDIRRLMKEIGLIEMDIGAWKLKKRDILSLVALWPKPVCGILWLLRGKMVDHHINFISTVANSNQADDHWYDLIFAEKYSESKRCWSQVQQAWLSVCDHRLRYVALNVKRLAADEASRTSSQHFNRDSGSAWNA